MLQAVLTAQICLYITMLESAERIYLLHLPTQYPDSGVPQHAVYYQSNLVSYREECILFFKMYYTNWQELQLYKASDAWEKYMP